MPNRDILQRRVAECLAEGPEGGVCVAPPVFMFSVWTEETAVRLRMLSGLVVPRSQGALASVRAWRHRSGADAAAPGPAFELNAARQARAADRLLRHWIGEEDLPWLQDVFFEHRRSVRRVMEAEGVFSAEDWLLDLTSRLRAEGELPLPLPRQITLEGFVELTPLERGLLDALEVRGVKVDHVTRCFTDSQSEVLEFATPEDEWQAAARWAYSKLESGASSLCVVIPPGETSTGPSSRRVRQAFSTLFHGEEAARLDDRGIADFHIPAGGRLSHQRVVDDALLLLRFSIAGADHRQQFASLSQWLLSPHWAGADGEAVCRARLEWRLRKRGLFRLSLAGVARLSAAEGLGDDLRILIDRIGALPPLSASSDAGRWAHGVLRHWGWPGGRGEASAANGGSDPTDRFLSLIERLSELRLQDHEEAVSLLQATCAETLVPFGGGPLSRVQVLAPEVAAAGGFDGLWLCHADDTNWPPPVTANPYLPGAARAVIPRMNPDGQLEFYRALTAMLMAAAPEVRLSWSRDAGRGPRNVSGLLKGIPGGKEAAARPLRLASEFCPGAVRPADGLPRLEAVDDKFGVPYPEADGVALPGGSDFFRLQAACPLWAYLRHRLGAGFPAMPGPLADPAFRGVLLHGALRELYARATGDRGMPGRQEIPAAVEALLSGLQVREHLTATGLRAEQERLERALNDWLELDGSREGFQVAFLEQAYELPLGRALVRVRIDRMDRLDDGRFFLIDYKSSKGGRSRALKWLRQRLQEPQLPLYAVLLEAGGEGGVGGMAFAAVRPNDCAFDGISDDESSAAGGIRVVGRSGGPVRTLDWPGLSRQWREQAEALCEEILAGRADNRNYDRDALEYNDVALILRHEELAGLFADEEDQGDAG